MKTIKYVLLAVCVVAVAMYVGRLVQVARDPGGYGIHGVPGSKNVAIIQGSCVTINWYASEAEWNEAMILWRALRRQEDKLVK